MEDNQIIQQLKEIKFWFTARVFYFNEMPDEDKVLVIQILLHEYAEKGELLTCEANGERYFIHPETYTKLNRESSLEILLGKNKQDPSE